MALSLLAAGEEEGTASYSHSRRQFRSGRANVCLFLTTERNLLQESLHKVTMQRLFKRQKKKKHPRVPFLVDGETLPVWLLFLLASSQLETVGNLSLVMELPYGKPLGGAF